MAGKKASARIYQSAIARKLGSHPIHKVNFGSFSMRNTRRREEGSLMCSGSADICSTYGRLTSKEADPENDVPQYLSSLDSGNTSNSNQRYLGHLERE